MAKRIDSQKKRIDCLVGGNESIKSNRNPALTSTTLIYSSAKTTAHYQYLMSSAKIMAGS